jgi:glycosyltransferase involved in cell wall biosynthesis
MAKRVLFCYPWPLHEAIGARVVLLSYARALVRQGLLVDCFAPAPVALDRDANGLFLGVFDRLFSPPRTSPTLGALLDAAGAGCVDPALPSRHGCDGAAMVAAAAVASTGNYDLIGIHYTRWHAIQPLLPPGVPAMIFTHELDALVAVQEARIFGTASTYTLDMEADRLSAFDAVTTVGATDRERLLQLRPAMPVHTAPITVEMHAVTPVRPDARVLLLLSSSAIFHELSLAWFLTHAWPAIKVGHPSVRLVLAGRICEAARGFGADRDPQIDMRGPVADPESLYAAADVFIAPYYFGDGIKLKVLEALARGLPVVTTTPGLSNSDAVAGRDALVGDDGDGFAEAVLRLLRQPALRESLQRNALQYIKTHHHPAVADRALQAVVRELLDRLPGLQASSEKHTGRTPARFVGHLQQAVARALHLPDASEPEPPALAYLAQQLRALLPWTLHRSRAAGVTSLAVYGAGSHTRLMLPMWRALGGVHPSVVLVSGTPNEPTCCGVPVISIDAFDPASVDGILLSSQGFERAMAETCAERFPLLPVFPIWSPPLTAGESSAIPLTHSLIPVADTHATLVHR